MTGNKTPQAGLLSAIPGTDKGVRIAFYFEHWGCVEFLDPIIELKEQVPTFCEPRTPRKLIRLDIDNGSVGRPMFRDSLPKFFFLTKRNVSHFDQHVFVSLMMRQDSLERLFPFYGERSFHSLLYCGFVFTYEFDNPKVISNVCSNYTSSIDSI